MKTPLLVLASASPRRVELLRQLGIDFEVLPAAVEEVESDHLSPYETSQVNAYRKARAVSKARPDVLVLAADTEVVVDCRILGKPASPENAGAMLRILSGAAHDVLTAVVVRRNDREVSEVLTTRVYFAPLSPQDIGWYLASGEPMGKAGAYAIQGLGARFVERIEGSWSSVVGLPIATVHRLLREVQ